MPLVFFPSHRNAVAAAEAGGYCGVHHRPPEDLWGCGHAKWPLYEYEILLLLCGFTLVVFTGVIVGKASGLCRELVIRSSRPSRM